VRFLLDVISAIRSKVGREFHVQVKIGAVDRNNVVPWEKKGNTLNESVQVAQWCEAAGADAIHVSTGSLFPHPLNPPGGFSFETITATYDAMISSGVSTLRNYFLFRYPMLRPIFYWAWFRMKRGRPIEGVGEDEAHTIKAAVKIPVISTGGWQTASRIRAAINSNACDGVSIARSLIANPNLPKFWAGGHDLPPSPCTYCNRCLLNAPKNPMGCYEPLRFANHDAMVEQLMTIYNTHPVLRVPRPDEVVP
jgi:2,4-dienoyl-CoA reductase-like NADH-dependent reductase (Old Yellow Enzyme family)